MMGGELCAVCNISGGSGSDTQILEGGGLGQPVAALWAPGRLEGER